MKHPYRWLQSLLAASLLTVGFGAHAQQAWRPFRPGLIYTFGASPAGTGASYGYTLRLDSAYVTAAGDSAWAFNRVMRDMTGKTPGDNSAYAFRKSRNNLFGQRLLWQPGSTEFTLETVTEGTAQIGAALRLRPRAAVGSTWLASGTSTMATLTSRGPQTVNGQPDTVAVITLSTGPVVRLSRRFGLLEAPQWLTLGGSPAQWVATQVPQTLAQSPYYPTTLFGLVPGDELGYVWDQFSYGPFTCADGVVLRRVVSRQLTSDSLVIQYREQRKGQRYGAPGCSGPAGAYTDPVMTGRWAFSLRTGKSPQFSALPLLTGEYAPAYAGTTQALVMGKGLMGLAVSGSCQTPMQIGYQRVYIYQAATPTQYRPGLDAQAWQQAFAVADAALPGPSGIGDVATYDVGLRYVRRTMPSGVVYTCGSATNYGGLLPTRAAQAAALATLHPNPATEAATLTLAQPARAGQTLRLTDALGRPVWQAPVAAGQTMLTIPLAGQPAGLYLLHLSGSEGNVATWKLTHE
ncbi:T9SS type A sorting domain-containing protein [Hymenobacter properus]|uniref:T9SS type A sorting domain-containing protein n=1 Tax=Hymenobacter properus TaxID=2791026 RepID=A0A931BJM4_9BACT|nr:T9SS type A sorting domain-containing protein [Hymenobacter properus]MBF9143522.1 T9SS type A sorting domain-containing protein [Hymenobacter properus]MBR7722335.1 T9SS type A sorting domain-containing protein [Microvirga sp. SRT04]